MSFPASPVWPGVAHPLDPLGQPGVPGPRRTLRRWAALFALAGLALPGVQVGPPAKAIRAISPPPAVAAPADEAPVSLLPEDTWEAAVVETTPPPAEVPAPAAAPAAAPEEQARAFPATSGLVPESREQLRRWLVRYAGEHDLPADLIMAQAWKESSWRASAVSEDGATGVMQLMPITVTYVSRKLLDLKHNLDPLDPAANIRMGTRLMRHLVDRFDGDYRRALMAYNQGVTSLLANGPYGEARAYADTVMALRPQFPSS
ncbi:MAG: lytic transglycosylase domain-containing protein [Acidimicrobiia bacterium]